MTNQSIKAEGKEQSLNLWTQAYFELFYKYLCVRRLLGSFSIDDGDGIENVTIKMNSRFFKPFRFYCKLLKMPNVGEFTLVGSW